MIRRAYIASVNRGSETEYEKRHNPIWPELEAVLKKHGVSNYSIFLDEKTNQLFGYMEVEDEATADAVAQTLECKRWWAHMSTIMPSNPDNSPVTQPLREVFHLD